MKKLLLLITLLFSSTAFADLASGTFTPPTTRGGGKFPLDPADIGGYIVYLDGVPVPENDGGVLLPDMKTFAITILKTQKLTLQTFDKSGRTSGFSIPITISPISDMSPDAPTDVTVTITINVK